MKVTIITPSFNQAQFLPRTLASIKNQSQDNYEIEHIIIDPGSTDGSLNIISEYVAANSFARSVLGRDTSQTNAINIGFRESSGDILCWLNSDDHYVDDRVISDVANVFEKNQHVDVVYCLGDFIDSTGKKLKSAYVHKGSHLLPHAFLTSIGILQPAVFLKRTAFERVGPLDESMHYSFDYEYWVRLLLSGCRFEFFNRIVAAAVIHEDAKTMRARGQSLKECVEVASRNFGFSPYEWIERLVDCEQNGADGILTSGKTLDDKVRALSRKRFLELNANQSRRSSILSCAEFQECRKSLNIVQEQLDTKLWIVTSFDSAYFDSGLTLLSGLCKQGYATTPKIVFDLGLIASQRATIQSIDNTFVISFNRRAHQLPEWFFHPKSYVYKLLAMEHMRHIAREMDVVLWIDSGVYPAKTLDPIVNSIRSSGAFFVDHDDRPNWPIYNITFTSDECCLAIDATMKELLAPHLCSCLMGFLKGHNYENIFRDGFEFSKDPRISQGDKHPAPPVKRFSKDPSVIESERVHLLNGERKVDLVRLRDTFGYYGHRQDQSIVSILASRYGAEISSAKRFCVGSDASSRASKLNWDCRGLSREIKPVIDSFSEYPDAVTVHHRGTVVSFDSLTIFKNHKREAIILGNGPSLRGFDMKRLERFDVFGMNAAYRFWYETNYFPQFYSCLDLVVGSSHRLEIAKLIERSDELGIRGFLLRQALIEELGDIALCPKVFNFDLLRKGFASWQAEPVTTGSHTCAWASILGYRDIYLLGIDCNYVEVVQTAERRNGNVLEIVGTGANPNYFFDGYQRPGDKYNLPNPSKDLHIRSWRNVAQKINDPKVRILNANLASKVDAFPFIRFEDVERGGKVQYYAATDVTNGSIHTSRDISGKLYVQVPSLVQEAVPAPVVTAAPITSPLASKAVLSQDNTPLAACVGYGNEGGSREQTKKQSLVQAHASTQSVAPAPVAAQPTTSLAAKPQVVKADVPAPPSASVEKRAAPVVTASSTTSPAAKLQLVKADVPAPSITPVSLPKSAVSSPAVARPKPAFVSRLSVDMGQLFEGTNWSEPTRVNGTSVRLVASGQRATMALSLKRDHALLLLLTLPPRSSREHYDGVRLEIDGTVVSHTLHLDIDPPYLVASVPVTHFAQNHPTRLTIQVPNRTEPQGLTGGKHAGFAVSKLSVIPAFPKNEAGALTIGKPWSQRLASRLNKEPLAFPFSHFDGLAYVAANPDIAKEILGGRLSSGLRHYQKYGRFEGRACAIALKRNPNIGGLGEIFDGQAYLETYPDIAEAVRNGMRSSALEHYVQYGRTEGRRAKLRFDGSARRGTAVELVEFETLRATRAATEAIRVSISKEVAKQVGQVSSELTRVTSTLQAKLEHVAQEQSSHQAAQATKVAADLARTAGELRGDLAWVAEEQSARQATQVAQMTTALARTAEELRGELTRVSKEQSARHAAQATKGAGDLARTAEELRGELARVTQEQSAQVATNLANTAEELRGELARVTKEQSAQQAAQVAALAGTADELRGELARVAKEQIAQLVAACVQNGNGGGARNQLVLEMYSSPICGPYSRSESVHYDETHCIAKLLGHKGLGSVMVDVGAHFGTALAPFLELGWKIFAFEPDEKNRQKLLELLAKHRTPTLVKLDHRAVSNESKKGLSFYRSEVSTGISGLSAFHPSHKAEQMVDTVTLTEALSTENLEAVDFLKIDTEGHDLFVLKGFPWERFRPAVIECEFEDAKTVPLGYTFHDLARYLVEKGYTVYVSEWHPIIRYGVRHDWHRLVRYPCELADTTGWGNLLAFREPIDEAALVAAVRKVMKVWGKPANGTQPAPAGTVSRIASPQATQGVVDLTRVADVLRAELARVTKEQTTKQATQVAALAGTVEELRGELARVTQEQSTQQAAQVAALAGTVEELRGELGRVTQEQSTQQAAQVAALAGTVEELRGELARVTQEQSAQQVAQVAALAGTVEELRGELARVTKEQSEQQAVQAAKVASDLAHTTDELRGELARVTQEQSAQQVAHAAQTAQVAGNLARTAEELRAELARVTKEQAAQQAAQAAQATQMVENLARTADELRAELTRVTKEQSAQQAAQAAQTAQVAGNLARTAEELRAELARVTKEQAAQQAAQATKVAADLARTAEELRAELARVTKEQSAQEAAQAWQVGQVATKLARTAEELRAELDRVTKEQSAQQAAQTTKVAADLTRTAEELRGELARVTKEQTTQQAAQTAQAAQMTAALARTAEELRAELSRVTQEQNAQQVVQRRMEAQDADIRREVRDGLSRTARAAELVRVEQAVLEQVARMRAELEAVKGAAEAATQACDQQARLAAERLKHINELQQQIQGHQASGAELASRQQLMQKEVVHAEAQLNLIKTILLREPGL